MRHGGIRDLKGKLVGMAGFRNPVQAPLFCSLLMRFEHSFVLVESLYNGRSLFAICLAQCSQFERSRDSTIQFLTMCNRTSCGQVQELP